MTNLHVCSECSSDLVYPVTWSEAENDCWDVSLRCPECENFVDGTFHHAAVESFDNVLNQGTALLIDSLTKIERRNMQDYIASFVSALDQDALLPEDF